MKILFVCYGNMCRSPMAEGFARKMLANQVNAESAGTHAVVGNPASREAVEVMNSRFGVDISSHRSRNVRDLPLDAFDCIVPLDDTVADDLRMMYPSIIPKLVDSWNIDDPIGRGVEAYETSATEIQKHVEDFSTRLRENRKK